ncbi:MAG TPA: macro domain-containing protein [Tepidisphaeraceae bacterium]|jgi:O-acetyl-ADP-ribose deacetylase (regulator of RNase III)|nr:macro domain-containing protein [Tepidisphaeraceae bacterium]
MDSNHTKGAIHYLVGDATAPQGDGPRIIAHVCNDLGRWGRGFVLALSKRWHEPEARFRAWHRNEVQGAPPFELGQVQFVAIESDLWVANMIGQHGIVPKDGVQPVRYEAIRSALMTVSRFAKEHHASVHMPRIGCGVAGGTWDIVGPIVQQTLADAGVNVFVYDLPSKD